MSLLDNRLKADNISVACEPSPATFSLPVNCANMLQLQLSVNNQTFKQWTSVAWPPPMSMIVFWTTVQSAVFPAILSIYCMTIQNKTKYFTSSSHVMNVEYMIVSLFKLKTKQTKTFHSIVICWNAVVYIVFDWLIDWLKICLSWNNILNTLFLVSMQTAAKTMPSSIYWLAWRTMDSAEHPIGKIPAPRLFLVQGATTATVMRKRQGQSWTRKRPSLVC